MAIAEMKKVYIFGLKKNQDRVLEFLQTEGITQIKNLNEVQLEDITKLENDNYNKAKFCVEFLKLYAPKKGMFDTIKQDIKEKPFSWIKRLVNEYPLEDRYDELRGIEASLRQLAKEEREINNEIYFLKRYSALSIDVKELKGFKWISYSFIIVEQKFYTQLLEELNNLYTYVELIHEDKKYNTLIVMYHKDETENVFDIFSRFNVVQETLSFEEGTVKDHNLSLNNRLSEIINERELLISKAKRFSDELENLEIIYDYYASIVLRHQEAKKLIMTDYTFSLEAFVPFMAVDRLKKSIMLIDPNIELIITYPEDDEDIPILLENNSFIKPVETVTSLYSYPHKNEYDPTPILAGFFLVFFGICLTDAAYGAILTLLAMMLIKYLSLHGGVKKIFQLLAIGGVFTVIIGTMAGGWFGISAADLPDSFSILKRFQIIDPTKDAIKFLVISLVIGVFHLVFGLLVKAVMDIKRRDFAAFLFDDILWAVYIFSITVYLFTNSLMVKNIILVCMLLIVLTGGRGYKNIFLKIGGGLLSLYGTMGYLSDVLSYSRLMALGLATGGIAMVINMLSGILKDMVPGVGILIAILFLPLAHLANIVMNVLGAFIHSARLQYIEFFPKFFEGGGKPFRPFRFVFRKVNINKN